MRITPTSLSMVALVVGAVALGAVSQNAPIDADSLRVLATTQEMRIGNADDPALGFSAIRGVHVDRDGAIYAFDTKEREIRVFASDGKRLRTIGRPGRGPGEFERTPTQWGLLGDSVWAYEDLTRRVTVFRRNGDVVSTKTLPSMNVVIAVHDGGVGMLMPRGMRSDGSFVSHLDYTLDGTDMMAARMRAARGVTAVIGPRDTVKAPRVVFAPAKETLDTIGWEPVPPADSKGPPRAFTVGADGRTQLGGVRVVNGVSYTVPQAPGDWYIRMPLDDGSAIVNRVRATSESAAEFSVSRFDISGKTIFRLRFRYQPSRYAGAILDTIAMRPVQRAANPSDAAFRAVRSALQFPEFQSPVYSAWGANDGSLWIRRQDNATARMQWIVIERSGAVRGIVEVPRSSVPAWASGTSLIVVDTDDDGVPWLVRYRVVAMR